MGCYQGLTNGSIGWKPKPTHQKKKQQLPPSPSSSSSSAPNLPTEKKGGPAAAFRRIALGLTLLLSLRRRRRQPGLGLEKRSLLLADTGQGEAAGLEGADSHSVHSSFRFSFGSQAEAEEPPVPAMAAATVLLLVNVEGDGGEDERVGGKREGQPGERQQWRRLESLERSISPVAAALVRFTYAQIRAATRDFARGRELGRGALSRVYKGRMSVVGGRNGVVAVKKVEGEDRESAKAFCRELLIASSLRNPNVVPLLGFCVHQEGLFLVYKYVSGGSLDHHLHPNEKRRKVLPWEVRYKVAMGVAQAIGYLHYGTDKCVVHRDIKPSNILLSSNKTPKLCDFGLATWTHGPSLPFLCKAVKGTFGYLAPEYFQHGKLSDKTDVYAFGVVLLELITGRKAIDRNGPQGDENLVLWAKPLLQQGEGTLEKLVDPRLKPGTIRWNEMSRMVRTATACVHSEESGRPNIDQVIGMLQEEEEDTCTDWSIFTGPNSCLIAGGYGSSHLHGSPPERCDIMKGHLALAMLGVSDTEEDDTFSRC